MHIGIRIKEVLDSKSKGQTATWFAQQLHCDRRNVYSIFSRASIDTDLLRRISVILDHDFFRDLSEEYGRQGTDRAFGELRDSE
ncbi:MAG: XRE family transcriptional regulator [Paramuribaculum sp.]|nr:XRE family transcriptional regulator [Paramuribaculum sp.]